MRSGRSISGSISARRRGPRGRQPVWTARLAAVEVFLERFGEDPAPAILGGQLLRTSRQGPEEAGDPPQCPGHRLAPTVVGGHRQPGLAGMMGLAGHAVQEQRPAGDRLAVAVGVGVTFPMPSREVSRSAPALGCGSAGSAAATRSSARPGRTERSGRRSRFSTGAAIRGLRAPHRLQLRDPKSNVPIHAYRNHAVLLGISRRF